MIATSTRAGASCQIELSVVIPVVGRHDDPAAVYAAYRSALRTTGLAAEFIYVLDGAFPGLVAELEALQSEGEPIRVVRLSQRFGEAICVNVGVERASGSRALILPPYLQIEPRALPSMLAALERADLVAAVRDRAGDHPFNRFRAAGLEQIARLAGSRLRDLGCLVIAARRAVLQEIVLQDEHHRFLPLLARNAGFVVEHLVLPQADSDRRVRLHGPMAYLGRMLDLIAIAFLLRFIQRPFRFFGSVGVAMAVAGLLLGSVLAFERLVLQVPLAERPALLLGMLLVVLGIQIAAVGLIAEIIIFTRSSRLPIYRIDQVVERAEDEVAVAVPSEPDDELRSRAPSALSSRA